MEVYVNDSAVDSAVGQKLDTVLDMAYCRRNVASAVAHEVAERIRHETVVFDDQDFWFRQAMGKHAIPRIPRNNDTAPQVVAAWSGF
jgi:hypothetical protein